MLIDPHILLTSSKTWKTNSHFDAESLLLFPRRRLDRSCLHRHPKYTSDIAAFEQIDISNTNENKLLSYVNSKCGTFRDSHGQLSQLGRKRSNILKNIYRLPRTPIFPSIGSVCKRIRMPNKEEFINHYLYGSQPVIFEDALKDWPALQKWSNLFLRNKFGKNKVHVKLTPDGIFEGCEKAENFSNFKSFVLPEYVKKQLKCSDLVVVRPATMNINFSSFINMIETGEKHDKISAYLEYSSIPHHMPELEDDIREFEMVKDVLERRHLNIWLSKGNTVGKLHFDPFENFLCQISGSKQVLLFEPHDNTLLYEGHIQEALLHYDKYNKTFSKHKLLDSTSMVMSPVNIKIPDYQRFPNFKKVPALNCTINEGDVLYLPAFWWHEVISSQSKHEQRNLAVNFWYEPFFSKEFPCAECKLDINRFYMNKLL